LRPTYEIGLSIFETSGKIKIEMLLSDKEYKQQLEIIAEQIKSAANLVDIRGSSVSQFIYAKNESRSLEISQFKEGIWIEFWQVDNDEPIKEMAVSCYGEATAISLEWLKSDL
jgi:hypothetical protein